MGKHAEEERIDRASRVILASPRSLFRAFLDPEMLASWRTPEGMGAQIERFVPGIGGGYRIVLTYAEGSEAVGKTGVGTDVAEVRFVELLAEERIVEEIRFLSDDPAYSASMRLVTTFEPVADGTKVSFAASGVPAAIDPDDHKTGMASALRSLALLTE